MTEAETDWLRSDKSTLVSYAAWLFVLWSIVTWLLEGRIETLLRPGAVIDRLIYAVVANLLVGTVGAALVLRAAVVRGLAGPSGLGLAGPGRTVGSLGAGVVLGGSVLFFGRADLTPVMAANLFAQTLVVSIAEVTVCFAAIGGSVVIFLRGAGAPLRLGLAVLAGAGAFGVYHFAHSPPYNSPALVLMLTQVGFASAAFFFLARDLYGTILFHNFLAARGVSETLARNGRLEDYTSPRLELLVMALLAVLVLVVSERFLVRRYLQQSTADERQPSRG